MNVLLESIRFNDGRFPRQELQQLIDNKDEATPHLLAVVEETANDPDLYLSDPSRIDLFYSLYLLAQFRETQLFPRLIRFLTLPGEAVEQCIGDVITEGVGRILASVYSGDPEPIQSVIENDKINEFVRGQGLHAMCILALNGRLDREWVIDYFIELLEEKISGDHPIFNAHIVSSLVDIHGQRAYAAIKRCYDKGLVDTMLLHLEDVERVFKIPEGRSLETSRNNMQFQFIEDTIKELEDWACFEQPPSTKGGGLMASGMFGANTAAAAQAVKIGRNEPCPCGSGLKYKKCCGK